MANALVKQRMPSFILFVPDKMKPVESALYLGKQVERLQVVGLHSMFSDVTYQAVYNPSEICLERRVRRETQLFKKKLISEVFYIGTHANEECAYLLSVAHGHGVPIINCAMQPSPAFKLANWFQPITMRHWYETYQLKSA